MRHANMDEYNSVGPCAYSMCMMIELRSAPVQLSLAQQAAYVHGGPGSTAGCRAAAITAAFSLRLAALVPDRIFWQFLTISPASQQI
jgi:hypothetical protein